MALVLRPDLDRSLAMSLMPTSTTHPLSRSTTLAVTNLATLFVDRRIALIAENTVLINVVEGANLLCVESVESELTITRYHDDRNSGSDDDARYRRRSSRFD